MKFRWRERAQTIAEFAFGPASAARFQRAQIIFLTLLCLLGGLTWLRFFQVDSPDAAFHAIDWGVEWQYYEVIQEAYQTRQVPYHVSVPVQPIQPTQRFLAIPEALSPLAPQAPLLAFLTVKHFVIVNVLLHYLAGFWGCLLLRKRFDFSPFVFLVLFLLFNFNGHIIAHVAAGHKWNGYFYLPFFAAFVLDAVQRTAPVFETAAKIAVVNLFILLQGTLHPFADCMLLLGLVVVFSRPARATALLAMTMSALLAVFRLWPAAMTTRRLQPDDFADGYRSLAGWWDAMVSVQLYPRAKFPWEYNLYLSVLGVVFVLGFGVLLRFSRRPELAGTRFRGLGWPIVLLTVFAFRDYWFQAIYQLPDLIRVADKIPNTERIPSRFVLLPLIFLLVIACVRMQRLHRLFTQKRWLGAGMFLGVFVLAAMLRGHRNCWRISSMEQGFVSWVKNLADPHITTLADPAYLRIVHRSLACSLLALAAILAVWLWRRHARTPQADVSRRWAMELSVTDTPWATRRARRWMLLRRGGLAGALLLLLVVHEGRWWFSPEGLLVTYYRGTQLHHARARGVEMILCRSFVEDPPAWWLGWAGFSSRWTGALDVPRTADYTFHCQSCDGARFYLDGRCVIDNWRDQSWQEGGRAVTVHLTQGLHPLMLEHYSRKNNDGGVRVRWCGGGIPENSDLSAPYLRKRS